MNLPTSINLPWKPDQAGIISRSGYVINEKQVEYLKQIIKAISKMYSDIANAHNLNSFRNNGTASVASGDTTVVVTHGVSKTPALKDISITPNNIPTNAVRWAVTAADATTFTITTSADPGVSGADFAWQVYIL